MNLKSKIPLLILAALVASTAGLIWWARPVPPTPVSTGTPTSVASAPQPQASQPAAADTPAPAASQAAIVVPAPVASAAEPTPAPTEAPAAPTEHPVKPGEILSKIVKLYLDLELDWREVCLENRKVIGDDCHNIRSGMVLSLVVSAETKARMGKVGKRFFLPKERYQVTDCSRTKLGYCVFSRPGGDPVCKKADQIAVLARDLEIPKEEAAKWLTAEKERKLIPAGSFIDGLSFGHGYWKGKVLVKQDMWANVGEVGGKAVGQFELCCNFFNPPTQSAPPAAPPARPEPTPEPEPKPEPQPTPEPEPKPEPEPEPEPTPTPTTPPPSEEEDVVAYNYDRDLTVYAGLDKDVKYAGSEGAFYPALFYYPWGRYALGIGGFANVWDGETPGEYHFGGRYGAGGLAHKWSTWAGEDFGLKFPMIGIFAEHGRNKPGFFQEHRDAKLWCASASYNDARREKRGLRDLPEWQVWLSFCDPFSQAKSRTVFGQSVDSSSMSDIRYILSVGGRVFLSKDLTNVFGENGIAKKVQPFVELGLNRTAPNPFTAHLYGGLRTVNKVWSAGAGLHISEQGVVIGATGNYDVGRHLWLKDKEERWAEMVQSLEALGVAVD